MVVSMFQIILELPETGSIKDKRRLVKGLCERLRNKYRVSCAEVDLNDSLRWAQLGAALVSNSKEHGETVMRKALETVEVQAGLRVHDMQVHSEVFD
ncbi:MAG TPA: DUF503 domain-containing protein [Spirochaetales bacterium]|nr:DUF503 domain-containing protein [Spirochaetales bacterium]